MNQKKRDKQIIKENKKNFWDYCNCEFEIIEYLLTLNIPDLKINSHWAKAENVYFCFHNKQDLADDEVVKLTIAEIIDKHLFSKGILNFSFVHDFTFTNWDDFDTLENIFMNIPL